jgi:hypothetical protein
MSSSDQLELEALPRLQFSDNCAHCKRIADVVRAQCARTSRVNYLMADEKRQLRGRVPAVPPYWVWRCAHCSQLNVVPAACIGERRRHHSPAHLLDSINRAARSDQPDDCAIL